MAALTWSEPHGRRDTRHRAVRVAACPAEPGSGPMVVLNLMVSTPDGRRYDGPLQSVGQANLTPDRARKLAYDLTTAADVAERQDEQRAAAMLRRWIDDEREHVDKAARLLLADLKP